MLYLLVSFFVAAAVTLLVIHSARSHAHISADSDLDGPQKFHATPVPRIGGVGMFGSMGVDDDAYNGNNETVPMCTDAGCTTSS